MVLRLRSTRRLTFSRLFSVSICLCAFLPLTQLAGLPWVESIEAECPCQEDGESSEEKQVVFSSARRRLNNRHQNDFSRPREPRRRLYQIASCVDRLPAIVGHQLTNGLCAPLLI